MRLPPFGMLSRDLTLDALGALADIINRTPSLSGIGLEFEEGGLNLSGTPELIARALNRLLVSASSTIEKKLERFRDFKIHVNDSKTFTTVIGSRPTGFGEAILNLLRSVRFDPTSVHELSIVELKEKGNEVSVILGSEPELAMPMLFLIERTEASHEWGKGRGGKSIRIRGTKEWLALLASGFALSYSGLHRSPSKGRKVHQDVLLVHLTEDVLSKSVDDPEIFSVVEGFLLPIITTCNQPTEPRPAFHLYLSALISLEVKGKEGILKYLEEEPLTFEMDRIRVQRGRSFTLYERFPLEYSALFRRMSDLNSGTLQWMVEISGKALRGKGLYISLSEKLYQALIGSYDILDTAYYALRVVGEENKWAVKDLIRLSRP